MCHGKMVFEVLKLTTKSWVAALLLLYCSQINMVYSVQSVQYISYSVKNFSSITLNIGVFNGYVSNKWDPAGLISANKLLGVARPSALTNSIRKYKHKYSLYIFHPFMGPHQQYFSTKLSATKIW